MASTFTKSPVTVNDIMSAKKSMGNSTINFDSMHSDLNSSVHAEPGFQENDVNRQSFYSSTEDAMPGKITVRSNTFGANDDEPQTPTNEDVNLGATMTRPMARQLQKELASASSSDDYSGIKAEFTAKIIAQERDFESKLQKAKQETLSAREETERHKREIKKLEKSLQQMRSFAEECRNQLSEACGQLRESGTGIAFDSAGHESIEQVQRERDAALEDNRAVENNYADLFRRYERLREKIFAHQKTEDQMREQLTNYEGKCKRLEDRFARLKEHANDKLEMANSEIDKLNKLRDQDTVGLRAQLRKANMQIESLEFTLQSKQKEIKELTNLCDELIGREANAQQSDA